MDRSNCFEPLLAARFGGHARKTIDLARLLPPGLAADAAGLIRTVVWVDLIVAPERVARMAEFVARRPVFKNLREMAKALDTHLSTVQRALKLHRLLEARGLASPYVLMTGPPGHKLRWRKRFRFERLDGFPRWSTD